jgi:putative endonuclease
MASSATGARAEALAARYLQAQGFQILRQNYRAYRVEIDIIALEGQTLCFVEVRYREHAEHGHPLSTISPLKQRRIAKTASAFLSNTWAGPRCACRFDVVTIVGKEAAEILLLRNAYEAPSETGR